MDTDEINAWIFNHSRTRLLGDVLNENKQVFEALMRIVEDFPDDIQIKVIEDYPVVHLDKQQFSVGYFFNHLDEEHKALVQEWLEKKSN